MKLFNESFASYKSPDHEFYFRNEGNRVVVDVANEGNYLQRIDSVAESLQNVEIPENLRNLAMDRRIQKLFEVGFTVKLDFGKKKVLFQPPPKRSVHYYNCSSLKAQASSGSSEAARELGSMYQMGLGVLQSSEEAEAWYQQSADHGNTEAKFQLGMIYFRQKLYPEAFTLFQEASQAGHPEAIYNLGVMHTQGLGVEKSYPLAAELFRKGADLKHPPSMHNLGFLYKIGKGVPKSIDEAIKDFTQAAELGYAVAQNDLGILYLHGNSVPQSYEKAFYWLSLGANKGPKDAKKNLARLYESGQGTKLSLGAACIWYFKAKEVEKVLELLERGASVDKEDDDGNQLLHLAAASGDASIVSTILEKHGNREARNHFGLTPWNLAVENGHKQIMTPLLEPSRYHEAPQRQFVNGVPVQTHNQYQEPIGNRSQNYLQLSLLPDKEQDNIIESNFSGEALGRLVQEIDSRRSTIEVASNKITQQVAGLNHHTHAVRISELEEKLEELAVQNYVLMQERQVNLDRINTIERFKDTPTLFEFYKIFQVRLEELFLNAKSCADRFVGGESGKIENKTANVVLLGQTLDIGPIVGAAAGFLIKDIEMGNANPGARKNIAKDFSELATLHEIKKEIESAARQLTIFYEPKLRELPKGLNIPSLRNRMKMGLKKNQRSPATELAESGVLWIYEALKKGQIHTNNPLGEQFVTVIKDIVHERKIRIKHKRQLLRCKFARRSEVRSQ